MMNSIDSTTLFHSMVPAFCKSLEDSFAQMVMLPVVIGDAGPKEDGTPTGSISATIGLSGTHDKTGIEIRAKVSLIFSEYLALRIYRSMMMMEEGDPVESAELQDVVGELANMTAGGAKTKLSDHDFKLMLSLPTIAVGQDHFLRAPSGVAFSEVLPVALDEHQFYMEISIS